MNDLNDRKLEVSLLGCGWLGVATAQALLASGAKVRGSTTRVEKLSALTSLGVEAFLLRLDADRAHEGGEETASSHYADFLSSQTLILNIPPTSAGLDPEDHLAQIRSLLSMRGPGSFKHLIFVSSTSVYGAEQGDVDELTIPEPDEAGNGSTLVQVETLLRDSAKSMEFSLTIVRAGGLVGPGRHPGLFLAGKKNAAHRDQPVNLVHQSDLADALAALAISNDLPNPAQPRVFNAVARSHPLRGDFYPLAAKSIGAEEPTFRQEALQTHTYKRIHGEALRQFLGIEFRYDDWIKALEEKRL